MSVKKEPSGRRSVSVEIEVPGTPEEVWQAIATGPGVSSWFVPTEVEHGPDGTPTRVLSHFGASASWDAAAKVTAWDPPRRFAAESPGHAPNSPPVATEWIVEARSGGTCVVRVVHSLFASSDDWDGQLEGWEGGWPQFFQILRLYLLHFSGQPSSIIQLAGSSSQSAPEAWGVLTRSLGLVGTAQGERRTAVADAPPFSGIVERVNEGEHNQLLLRLDAPTPGLAHFFVLPMGGQVFLVVRLYLYGAQASATVTRDEPKWQAWLRKHFGALTNADNEAASSCG